MTTDEPATSEPVRRALIAYNQEQLGCAQSVLRGFQLLCGIAEEQVIQAKALGGGRAKDGRCGALHAALHLAAESPKAGEMAAAFATKAGSEHCREIRALKKVICAQCVELAATLLDQHRDKSAN